MKEKNQTNNEKTEPVKLKKVIFNAAQPGVSRFTHNTHSHTKQLLLLRALKVTQDPKKLKEMIGVRTVANVYMMLDRLSATKEYHKALGKNGVSMDFIVEGIKKEAISDTNKSADRLNAFKILMKSLGIDKYEESGIVGGSWEDVLVKKVEEERNKTIIEGELVQNEIEEYDVVAPQLPESVKITKEKEREAMGGLYE